jgi:hypothetical protein
LALAVEGGLGALDLAPLEAFIGTESDVIGDESLETSNVFNTETVEGGTDNVGRNTVVALSDLEDTRILVVEGSNEHGRVATIVLLEMDGTFREDGACAGGNIAENEASTVLSEHASAERAVDGKVNLSGSRVSVRSVQTTGTKEADS